MRVTWFRTRAAWRTTTAFVLAAAVVTPGAVVLGSAPADAATPGSFTGYAFDACHTPSQTAMDVWRERSQYSGIGVYIAGINRACPDQPNLTKAWVSQQTRKGWRLLPLTVGLQASCDPSSKTRGKRIDPDPAGGYASARAQGRSEARSTVIASRALGIAKGSTQWFDIENFDISKKKCRESALSFFSGWTKKLHALGYKSGVYSSASSGIRMLENARVQTPKKYALPDQIWIGDWNGKANTRSSYISDNGWMPHKRVHQYRGGHDEKYGRVRINVDSNFMDVGRGSVAPRATPHCGVQVDFPGYFLRRRGDRGKQVAAAQCLLKRQHVYHAHANGRFKHSTVKAVKRFQRKHPPLAVTGTINRRTWTVLLTHGGTPLMKYGAANNAVRRLQRGLNAANTEHLDVTGVFEATTRSAVKRYQHAHRLPKTGVVTDDMWALLRKGAI